MRRARREKGREDGEGKGGAGGEIKWSVENAESGENIEEIFGAKRGPLAKEIEIVL